MGIVIESDLIDRATPGTLEETDKRNIPIPESNEDKDIDFSDTLKAAFEQENIIGSAIAKKKAAPDLPVFFESRRPLKADFNPFVDIDGYEDSAEAFAFTNSNEEVQQIKDFIDVQRNSRKTLSDSGVTGFVASAIATLADPTILIPGGAVVKAGRVGTRLVKGATTSAAFAAGATVLQEGALQATQTERTINESVNNVLAASFLGGVLGGAISGVSKGVRKAQEDTVGSIINDDPIKVELNRGNDGSVSAAEVSLRKEEGLSGLNPSFTRAVSGFGFQPIINPVIQGLTSNSGILRSVTNQLFDHSFVLGKNIKGEASEVSILGAVKQDDVKILRQSKVVRDLYLQYSGVNKDAIAGGVRAQLKSKLNNRISFNEFNIQLAGALRRGDVHAIPEIQKAAKLLRKDFDEAFNKLQKAGLVAEDVDLKTATSYLTRRYNIERVVANETKFRNIILDHFRKSNPKLDNDELLRKAQDTVDKIKGFSDEQLQLSEISDFLVKSKTGAGLTKARVLNIPDEDLEEFLVNDALSLYQSYIHQANTAVRTKEFLDNRGVSSFNEVKQEIATEFELAKAKIPETDLEAIKKLDKENRKNIASLDNMVKSVLDQHGDRNIVGASFLRSLRKFQTITLLGGVLVSSLADLATPVFKQGLTRTVRDGYVTMARNLKASNLAKNDLKDIGVGLELEGDSILKGLTDPGESIGLVKSRVERGAEGLVNSFGKLSLITYWNNFQKRLVGQVSSARILRNLGEFRKTGKISDKERTRLASLGVGEKDFAGIQAQFDKFGKKQSGSFISGIDKWTDDRAKLVFGQAVLKDVESTIITPGKGDIPSFVQKNEYVKTIFQFKSFTAAATNKIVLSALQRRDTEALTGLTMMIGLGALVGTLKDKLAGREANTDIDHLLVEGVTRSGVIGLMGDAVASSGLFGAPSRFAGRTAVSFFLGPSVGLIDDVFQTANAYKDGEVSESDKKRLARLIPYQNLFYIRALLEKAKD